MSKQFTAADVEAYELLKKIRKFHKEQDQTILVNTGTIASCFLAQYLKSLRGYRVSNLRNIIEQLYPRSSVDTFLNESLPLTLNKELSFEKAFKSLVGSNGYIVTKSWVKQAKKVLQYYKQTYKELKKEA